MTKVLAKKGDTKVNPINRKQFFIDIGTANFGKGLEAKPDKDKAYKSHMKTLR